MFPTTLFGLKDGESIEWSQNAGFYIRTFLRNGCIPMLLLLMTPIILDAFVQTSPASLLILVALYNVIGPLLLFMLFMYMIYFIVRMKQTTYYITSQRLLEVRGGSIKKEIPKTNLRNLTPDQYLKLVPQQEQNPRECYHIIITDRVTDVAITMAVAGENIPKIIENWAKK